MLGQEYDANVDLWSVGVILYGACSMNHYIVVVLSSAIETLFGVAPFASSSLEELHIKVLDDRPVEVRFCHKFANIAFCFSMTSFPFQ